MKASLLAASILSCSVASIFADTASVTGVAVYESSGKRAGGVAVGLYATKDKGGHMGDDTTSNTGVFNTTTQNISPSVDELWVCSDSPAHVCDPQPAKLGSPKNGIRTGKTEDLRIISLTGPGTFTSKQASEGVGASANTAAVKLMAGRFSLPQAREWL